MEHRSRYIATAKTRAILSVPGFLYHRCYGRSASHIAYYSLREDTIYISAEHASLIVFSHEVGHAVVDHYFKVRPPYNIHELMAQFTSKHIQD